jgi:hypothetical protein
LWYIEIDLGVIKFMLDSSDKSILLTFLPPILIYLLIMIVPIIQEKIKGNTISFDEFIEGFLKLSPLFLVLFLGFVFPNMWESGIQISLKICLSIAFAFMSIMILLFWHYSRIDKND